MEQDGFDGIYQPDHVDQNMTGTDPTLAIAKFVELLQDNCAYPGHNEEEVAMSTALKKLAVKYHELVENNPLGCFGDALKKLWTAFFSASIRKILRELPFDGIEPLMKDVEKLEREEAEAKANPLGGHIIYLPPADVSGGSIAVNGTYHIHVWEDGIAKVLNLNGVGPVTISVSVQKTGSIGEVNLNTTSMG